LGAKIGNIKNVTLKQSIHFIIMTKIKSLITSTLFITGIIIAACGPNKSAEKSNKKTPSPEKKTTVPVKKKLEEDKKTPKIIPSKLLPIQKKMDKAPNEILVPMESITEPKMNIPQKWSDAFAAEEWQEYYHESSSAFMNGWEKELQKDSSFVVNKDDLLRIYRGKMEKIFYASPEFVEYSVQKLKSESQFELLEKKYPKHFN